MNLSCISNNKGGDSFKFSDRDNLLSLLGRPLIPSFEDILRNPSPTSCPPLSFHDRFEDPSMEPSPIRSNDRSVANRTSPLTLLSSKVESLMFTRRHQEEKTDNCQDLLDILDSVNEIVDGPKRDIEDLLLADQQDYGPSHSARRGTSFAVVQAAGAEATKDRHFRPSQEQQWQAQLQKLIQYKLEHRHCCVPHTYTKDPVLARWAKRQRYQYKKFNHGDITSTMSERRIQELESIGFVWNAHAAAWLKKLNELKAFKQRTGHCNVPSYYPEHASLSTWVKRQRRQYKVCVTGGSSSMTMERYQALEALGFVFEARQQHG